MLVESIVGMRLVGEGEVLYSGDRITALKQQWSLHKYKEAYDGTNL
jgi:hypothetical protein